MRSCTLQGKHQRVIAFLFDVCPQLVGCLFVQIIHISSDFSAGTLPRPCTSRLRKHFSAHAIQKSLWAHALFLEKHVHARVIGPFLHLRDTLPGALRNYRAPHQLPTQPNGRSDQHCPFSIPLKGRARETRFTSSVGIGECLGSIFYFRGVSQSDILSRQMLKILSRTAVQHTHP